MNDRLGNLVWALAAAGLVAAALYLGVAFGRPEALAFGLGLALVAGLSLLEARLLGRRLRVVRLLPPLTEDRLAEVRLVLENPGRLPLPPVVISDVFPPQVPAVVRIGIFPGLAGGAKTELRYRAFLNATRGLYTLGPIRARVFGPLGFASRSLVLEGPTQATVYPRELDVRRVLVPVVGESSWTGTLSAQLGQSTLFRGVREFQPGDPPRAVHWRSSARLGRLVVREFESLRSGSALLLLDLHRFSRLGVGRKGSVEYAVRVASALAGELFRRNRAVGLYAVDRQVLRFPPSRSRVMLARIRKALAEVRGIGEQTFEEVLPRGLAMVPGGLCVPILLRRTAHPQRILPPLLAHLRAGGRLVCVLIEAQDFVPIFKEQTALQQEARVDLASILAASGAELLSVGPAPAGQGARAAGGSSGRARRGADMRLSFVRARRRR